MFEYGCGGSTLFFAERAKKVISVEHDRLWFEKLTGAINPTYSNIELNFIPPDINHKPTVADPADPQSYVSSAASLNGSSFLSYASFIDKYPDNYFDIILIDGRARPSCLKHAVPKIKKGGYIILDDADRKHYLVYANELINDFLFIDFPGPVYGLETFYRTLILKKT